MCHGGSEVWLVVTFDMPSWLMNMNDQILSCCRLLNQGSRKKIGIQLQCTGWPIEMPVSRILPLRIQNGYQIEQG
jgi:hypothetical protein